MYIVQVEYFTAVCPKIPVCLFRQLHALYTILQEDSVLPG